MAHAAQAHAVCVCSVRARRPRRGPAPCRGVTPGSGAPGSGQLIVEFAAAGNVKALTRLLEIEYAVPDDELDSSSSTSMQVARCLEASSISKA